VIDLDPDAAFVGAVLHLPAPDALAALDLIHDEDLADPRLQVVVGLARQLAESGIDPDPVTVLAQARANGTVAKPDAIRGLTKLLGDVYGCCPVPASWRWYAVAVLDEALRRRCTEAATRLGQAADGESLESLLLVLDRETRAVRDVAERRAAAAGATARPRLASVHKGVSA
jgi:replicative DNA helicase